MQKFLVNKYITLSLQNDKTIILVNNEEFMQCKSLLLNIPTDHIQSYDGIKTIDDAIETYLWSGGRKEIDEYSYPISHLEINVPRHL